MVDEIRSNLSRFISAHIKEHVYPGASLAIYHHGQWQEAYYGTQDDKQPVTAGLVYDLASVSKVVGAGTLCLQALDEGKIILDEPLKKYYPKFHSSDVTLRQLLTHTSGIDPFIPNRDTLSKDELITAIEHITVTANKVFHYTDINFILLGLMLERLYAASLDELYVRHIFEPLGMMRTSFGPVVQAVPTVKGAKQGIVHDPKARVLGKSTGSAGLFSTMQDLERFSEYILTNPFSFDLWQDYAKSDKPRSLSWDLQEDWLLHTGYTGTFIMLNHIRQEAVIFLSNRTYYKDERTAWIKARDAFIQVIKDTLKEL